MARYTADEMREAANAVDEVSINDNGEYFYEKDEKFNPFLVRDMLRQAADMMEREDRKKRRRFQYGVRIRCAGEDVIRELDSKAEAEQDIIDSYEGTLVRREVGEWEVVKDV